MSPVKPLDLVPGAFFCPTNGLAFMFRSCYDLSVSALGHVFKELEMPTDAKKSEKLSATESSVVLDALDMYEKSLERAAKAAKDSNVADAYKKAGGAVRTLKAKIMSIEMEI